MGITTNDFFENICSVIFSPKSFFERDDLTVSVRLALGTVVFIAILNKIAAGIFDKSIASVMFIPSIIWHIFITLILWFITALFFEYIAKIFDRGGNFNKLLFYTAFAPVPYILFAPLDLIKQSSDVFYILASVTEFFIYLWIIWLYALSLKKVYNLSNARALMMIFIPFISIFFAIYWIVCFFNKLWYIFSI